MQGSVRALAAGLDVQQRYAVASSLDEGCELLLGEIQETTRLQRLAVVVGVGGHCATASVAVPSSDLERLVVAVRDGTLQPHRGLLPAEPPAWSWSLPRLSAFEDPRVVRFTAPADDFVGIVVFDWKGDEQSVQATHDAANVAAVHLLRAAQLEITTARLRESESRQLRSRGALDSLPDPVLVMDEDNRTLLTNRRAEALFVTGTEDSQGRRHAVETNNLFFSAFRAKSMLGKEARAGGRELLLVDPVDGSDLMFEVFSLPWPSGSHQSGLTYILRDITDLKQAALEMEVQYTRSVAIEHAARRESERLNVIIENVGAPILVTDRQTNVVLMNREAERLFELTEVTPGQSPRVRVVQDNDAKLAGLINDFLLQPDLRREGRLTLVDPEENREFPALALSTKIINQRHEPTAIVTVLHDLTQEAENRHLAEELRKLNAELEERIVLATRELAQRNSMLEAQRSELERASRMKSEFLAMMSHELRTPINAMLGYNSLLREGLFGQPTPRQDDALERMQASAGHLLSLINDILDLSTVEAGHVQLRPAELELTDFLDKVADEIRPLAHGKGIGFALEVSSEAPRVVADATRLRQVLLNLLSNAVKFTDEGGVALRVVPLPTPNPDRVRIEVEDTGIGIAADDIEVVFEEFRQVDQSVTRQHKGTGLGLAISRKLILLMGGDLGVRSTKGEGSTFHVELPLRPLGSDPARPNEA